MINVNDFKTGVTIKVDGNIFTVLEFQHVKPGKGPAFVRTKLKNLRTGATIDYTFNAGIKVETAMIVKMPMQFLYAEGNKFNFMNMNDYSQLEVDKSNLEDEVKYLKENLDVDMIFYEGEIIGVLLPDKIEMEIIHTEPAVKGNTANNAMKNATLETGYEIKVPLFIDNNEKILISTKDGKYVSRA
ncbi:MAG TPA: elongation factor P [Bacilli bacterium]|nr:elongation factor P [Bacilli bacterium]